MALGWLVGGGLSIILSMSYILIIGKGSHVLSHAPTHIRARIHTQFYTLLYALTDLYSHTTKVHPYTRPHSCPPTHTQTNLIDVCMCLFLINIDGFP